MSSVNLHAFNDQNFDAEVLRADLEVLVFFSATWASPCKQMELIVDKIADDYQGKIKVGKLDIDDSPNTPKKYGVRSVPEVMVFMRGQKSGMLAGMTSREKILHLLGLA